MTTTYTIGPKGQVVIPKELRATLGLEPGDEVTVWLEGDHVAVQRAAPQRPLRGRFRDDDLLGDLARERDAERQREATR